MLSKQRTTNVLIRLRGCAGCSAPLLFANGINIFSHDVAHMVFKPEDHWSCIAHLSAEDMLKSAVIEEQKFKNIESE